MDYFLYLKLLYGLVEKFKKGHPLSPNNLTFNRNSKATKDQAFLLTIKHTGEPHLATINGIIADYITAHRQITKRDVEYDLYRIDKKGTALLLRMKIYCKCY